MDSVSWHRADDPGQDCAYMKKKLDKCHTKVDAGGVAACVGCALTCGDEAACAGAGGAVCAEDEHVAEVAATVWACRACPAGTTRAAGDVVAAGPTHCHAPRGGHDHAGRDDHHKYVGGGAPWSTRLGPDPGASDGGIGALEARCKEPHPERTQWGHADPDFDLAIVAVVDADLPADEVPTVGDVRAHFWGPRAAAWLDKISPAPARKKKI